MGRSPGCTPSPSVARQVPLVGREPERDHLLDALGQGRNLLLTGPAGIGKTRLAREVLALEAATGRRTVDEVLACAGTKDLGLAAMAAIAGAPTGSYELGSQLGWHRARWRSHRLRGRVTLAWVDDLHHLDPASAGLVRQAVFGGDVQLLATARTHEPLPEDAVAMLVEGTLDEVVVAPLPPADAARLAALFGGGRMPEQRSRRIASLSAGLPLFVRELARGPDSETLPAHGAGASLLRERLDGLPPGLRRVAELVALAEPVPAALLADRHEHVAALMREGVLVRLDEGTLRLDHPLHAEWLAHRLGPTRADRYGELADRAARRPGLIDPARTVQWLLGAGRAPSAAQAAAVARLALARADVAALRRLLDHVGDERDLLRGQALVLDGDVDEGLDVLDEVRRTAPEAALRVEAASVMARHVGLTLGDPARAHAVLADTDDPALGHRLLLHLRLGRLWLRTFGLDLGAGSDTADRHADRHAEDVVVGDRDGDDQLGLDLATTSAAVLVQNEGTLAAQAARERMWWLTGRLDADEASRCRVSAVESWFQAFAGDLAGALRTNSEALHRLREDDRHDGYFLLIGNAAYFWAMAGHPAPPSVVPPWAAAAGATDPGGRSAEASDTYGHQGLAEATWSGNAVLADPHPALGDVHPERAGDGASDDAPATIPLLQALQARRAVWAAEAAGRDCAGRLVVRPLTALSRGSLLSWTAQLYSDCCDLRSPAAAHETVADAVDRLRTDGPLALAGQVARARLERDPAALLHAGLRLARGGYVLASTRALADVTRLPGSVDLRRRALRGLAAAYTQWRGAPMPWLHDVAGLPTPRQLEVARAVAAGGTREVAERLVLSRRTVENHVYRVSTALGTSAREELRAVLAHPCPELESAVTTLR